MIVCVADKIFQRRFLCRRCGGDQILLRIEKLVSDIPADAEVIQDGIRFVFDFLLGVFCHFPKTAFGNVLQKRGDVVIIGILYFQSRSLQNKKCAHRSKRTKTQTPIVAKLTLCKIGITT